MSACELRRNHLTKHCVFSIDSKNDIAYLPTSKKYGSGSLIKSSTCCQGSIAKCIDGSSYTLNGEDEWVLVREAENEAQSINIVRGTTLTVNIGITLSDGETYEAGDNDILRFCVKKDPDKISLLPLFKDLFPIRLRNLLCPGAWKKEDALRVKRHRHADMEHLAVDLTGALNKAIRAPEGAGNLREKPAGPWRDLKAPVAGALPDRLRTILPAA